MKRAHWLTAGGCLLLTALAGGIGLPALQHRLTAAANLHLAGFDTGHGPAAVRLEGLRMVLSGKVRQEAQRLELARRLRDEPWLPGRWLSMLLPALPLRNELAVTPYPPGWLALAVSGRHAELVGWLATAEEARDAARLLEDRWQAAGGRLRTRISADPARFDEAPDLAATLSRLPVPPAADGPDSEQIHLASAGGPWTRLPPDASDDVLRGQAVHHRLSETEWREVRELCVQVRERQTQERARLAEAARQARLPPPHILLAVRGNRLLVRGELASLGLKRSLLNALIDAFPGHRVLDDLRVNPDRRAVAAFAPVPAERIPAPDQDAGGSLLLGLPGGGWQTLPARADDASLEQAWIQVLPADLPPEQLADDVRMAADWLRGDARGIPSLPVPAQPSFLTLALLPDKVILAGQLAEEPLRARLVEAARRAYAGRAVLLADGLLARGTCEPADGIEQTALSLPPLPRTGEAPRLAFALPGQVWTILPAAPALLQPGGLSAGGLLPAGFPAAMAEHSLAEAFDHLRPLLQPAPGSPPDA